jgi:hypothetical protein
MTYIDSLREFFAVSNDLSEIDKQKVIAAVEEAVSKTRAVIAEKRVNGRDEASQSLSDIWRIAGNQLLSINDHSKFKTLALTLFAKSQYWSDPQGYSANRLTEYDITLNHVEAELKKLTA